MCRPFRELRALSRQRRILVGQRSNVRNRVQKIIDRAGARIGGILSDVFGVNGRTILDGLTQGTKREAILASLTGHVANRLEGLGVALSLSLGDNGRFMLNDLLEEHDALEARIASYTKKIDERMAPWEEQLRLLTTIPGIDRIAAFTILIEIGPGIEVFASKEHFAAWAGLCPGNSESGGKRRNARTPQGLQDPARQPRRVCPRRRPKQGVPVRGPSPRPLRPAPLRYGIRPAWPRNRQ